MSTEYPLRVALLDHTGALGGAELAMLRLLQSVDTKLFEPVVVLFSEGPLVDLLQSSGIPTYVLQLERGLATRDRHLSPFTHARVSDYWLAATFVRQLRSLLLTLRVDVVHTTSLKADVLGGLAGRLAGRPVLWHVHDLITADYLPAVTASCFRWGARHIPSLVITNSVATMRTLQPLGSRPHVVAYPGYALPHVPPERRRALTEPPLIGMVGRISPTKGQEIFLRAAAQLVKWHPRAQFRIVGAALFNEREYEDRIRALAADLGIADSVQFAGFVEEPLNEIVDLDLLVHASPIAEPFGQVILEGLALGVPVIATRGGGVTEIMGDESERLGTLVEPGSADELAGAMQEALDKPHVAKERALRARNTIQKRFKIETTALIVQKAWSEAAETSKRRSLSHQGAARLRRSARQLFMRLPSYD